MNEFMADQAEKRNYLTQDETGGDSRLAQLGHNKRKRRKDSQMNDSQDEDLSGSNLKHFTPGRIRASRMGLSNMQEYAGKR